MTPATITLFESLTDTRGRLVEATWETLFDQWRAPGPFVERGWSPATFEGNQRNLENVRTIAALPLDSDKGAALDDVCALLAGTFAAVHTTRRHTPTAPRSRAIVPLSRAVTVAEYAQLWAWAERRFRDAGIVLDPAPKDASRFWFLPGVPASGDYEWRDLPGALLDVDAILAEPSPAERSVVPAPTGPARRGGLTRPLQCAAAAVRNAPEGERNVALNREAYSVAGLPIDDATIRAVLGEAAHVAGLGAAEIRTTLDSAIPAGRAKPRAYEPDADPEREAIMLEGANGVTDACTDLANAERLVQWYGADLRHVESWGRWLAWNGTHWTADGSAPLVARAAVATTRRMLSDALDEHRSATEALAMASASGETDDRAKAAAARAGAFVKWSVKSQSKRALDSMVSVAQTAPAVSIEHSLLDADAWALNVANGTLDLRTGALRDHRRSDFMTKLAPVAYDPNAQAPRWLAFLDRAMGGDRELVAFLQRAAGYSLTGEIREHALFFCFGDGANGKSTFLRALQTALGGYATVAPRTLLFTPKSPQHPTEFASLQGARLVTCAEIEEGRELDEAKLKDLTGGDLISTRRMREDFWSFAPTHKLWLAGNHKPTVRGTDEGVWRRMRLVPWVTTIPAHERDAELPAKLAAELPGILRWCVDGCLAWQREGLGDPAAVRQATDAYREESDPLAEFFELRCGFEPDGRTTRKMLRAVYESFCEENGIKPPLDAKKFCAALRARGVRDGSVRDVSGAPRDGWHGVRVLADHGLRVVRGAA